MKILGLSRLKLACLALFKPTSLQAVVNDRDSAVAANARLKEANRLGLSFQKELKNKLLEKERDFSIKLDEIKIDQQKKFDMLVHEFRGAVVSDKRKCHGQRIIELLEIPTMSLFDGVNPISSEVKSVNTIPYEAMVNSSYQSEFIKQRCIIALAEKLLEHDIVHTRYEHAHLKMSVSVFNCNK